MERGRFSAQRERVQARPAPRRRVRPVLEETRVAGGRRVRPEPEEARVAGGRRVRYEPEEARVAGSRWAQYEPEETRVGGGRRVRYEPEESRVGGGRVSRAPAEFMRDPMCPMHGLQARAAGGRAVDPMCPVHGAHAGRSGGAGFVTDPNCPVHGRSSRLGGYHGPAATDMRGRGTAGASFSSTSVTIGGVKSGTCNFYGGLTKLLNSRNINVKNKLGDLANALRGEKSDGCYMNTPAIQNALEQAALAIEGAASACGGDPNCGK
jgi:hypothetical protein